MKATTAPATRFDGPTPHNPMKGLAFAGRVSEDFKLASGTWVNAGALRLQVVDALAPLVTDAVITGHDRGFIGALAFIDERACREFCKAGPLAPADLVSSSRAVAGDRASTEASQRHHAGLEPARGRALLLAEPPVADAFEITEKGYLNQRAVLQRRAALVDVLYARHRAVAWRRAGGRSEPPTTPCLRIRTSILTVLVLLIQLGNTRRCESKMSSENRYLEDLTVGERWVSEPVVISADDITQFGRLYDPQPFHVDSELAAQGPFGGLIASGWHLAAMAMRLSVEARSFGGTPIIGAGVDELRWLQPVRPGDVLTLGARVHRDHPAPIERRPGNGAIAHDDAQPAQRGRHDACTRSARSRRGRR